MIEMTAIWVDELVEAAPVYRCAICYRRQEDHRLPALSCKAVPGATFTLIPYASHAKAAA